MIPAEWPAQAADTIVDTIGKVRDKTTKPAVTIARGVVYGTIVAVMATVLLILFLVMLAHMWDNWMPGQIWIFYAILFALFSTGGLVLLRKANAPAPAADA